VGDFSQHRGFGWAGRIGEEHGMVWRNFGRNGGTVTPLDTVAQGLWLTTQADSALAEYPKADYVIFEGGCNDADRLDLAGLGALASGCYAPESDEDFTGAFETLILKLVTSFPNARLGYIVAPKMGTAGDYGSGTNRYRKFFDRAVEVCEKWGIPVLDLWKESPLNPMLTVHFDSTLDEAGANEAGKFYTDGQHLTLAGYKRISPKIASWMAGL
jgi:lysophospholipase L1-like esterase